MIREKRLPLIGIIFGALLSLGPVWGILLGALQLTFIFSILQTSGIGSPEPLAKGIGWFLMLLMAGLMSCPIGLILLVFSIVWYRRVKSRAECYLS